MKHFDDLAAAKLLSTGSYSENATSTRAGLKSIYRLSRHLTILFCLALLLTPALSQADSICFLTVARFGDAGYSAEQPEQTFVINNLSDWQALWGRLFINSSEKPSLPEVDFTRRTILAIFQGIQPTTGYEISIEEIVDAQSSLEVIVKAFAPGGRCGVLGKITGPLHIVEIEKTNKPVLFHVKHKTRNCV